MVIVARKSLLIAQLLIQPDWGTLPIAFWLVRLELIWKQDNVVTITPISARKVRSDK